MAQKHQEWTGENDQILCLLNCITQKVKHQWELLSLQRRPSTFNLVQASVSGSLWRSIRHQSRELFAQSHSGFLIFHFSQVNTLQIFSFPMMFCGVNRLTRAPHRFLCSTWKRSKQRYFAPPPEHHTFFPHSLCTRSFLFYFLCVVKPFVATREHPFVWHTGFRQPRAARRRTAEMRGDTRRSANNERTAETENKVISHIFCCQICEFLSLNRTAFQSHFATINELLRKSFSKGKKFKKAFSIL